jgi:hypothetical protein
LNEQKETMIFSFQLKPKKHSGYKLSTLNDVKQMSITSRMKINFIGMMIVANYSIYLELSFSKWTTKNLPLLENEVLRPNNHDCCNLSTLTNLFCKELKKTWECAHYIHCRNNCKELAVCRLIFLKRTDKETYIYWRMNFRQRNDSCCYMNYL